MRKVSKGLAIAAAVVAIGGVGLAVAQPAGPGFGPPGFMHGPGGPGMMHGMGGPGVGGPGMADPAAHLAVLKTRLGIRPEQSAVWDAYAKAAQDDATRMRTLHDSVDVDALRAMSWQEHQAFMGRMHDQQAQSFKAVQAAATALLAALDDGQKTHALMPALLHTRHGGMGGGMMGMMGGGPR